MKKIVTIDSLLSIDEMLNFDVETKKSFLWNMVSSDNIYEYDQVQKMNDQELNDVLRRLKKSDLTAEQQAEKLRAMFTNRVENFPMGEDISEKGDFNITEWDYSKGLPPRPLTQQELAQLTSQQKTDYFAHQMVANLNNPDLHGKST